MLEDAEAVGAETASVSIDATGRLRKQVPWLKLSAIISVEVVSSTLLRLDRLIILVDDAHGRGSWADVRASHQ